VARLVFRKGRLFLENGQRLSFSKGRLHLEISAGGGPVTIEEMYVRTGGVFQKHTPHVKVGTAWQEVDAYVKSGGVWVQVHEKP